MPAESFDSVCSLAMYLLDVLDKRRALRTPVKAPVRFRSKLNAKSASSALRAHLKKHPVDADEVLTEVEEFVDSVGLSYVGELPTVTEIKRSLICGAVTKFGKMLDETLTIRQGVAASMEFPDTYGGRATHRRMSVCVIDNVGYEVEFYLNVRRPTIKLIAEYRFGAGLMALVVANWIENIESCLTDIISGEDDASGVAVIVSVEEALEEARARIEGRNPRVQELTVSVEDGGDTLDLTLEARAYRSVSSGSTEEIYGDMVRMLGTEGAAEELAQRVADDYAGEGKGQKVTLEECEASFYDDEDREDVVAYQIRLVFNVAMSDSSDTMINTARGILTDTANMLGISGASKPSAAERERVMKFYKKHKKRIDKEAEQWRKKNPDKYEPSKEG